MGKTIRVSEEFYEWVARHAEDDESMEDALRRLTGGPDAGRPHPSEVAGLLTPEEAVKRLRKRDSERKRRVREAFSEDE